MLSGAVYNNALSKTDWYRFYVDRRLSLNYGYQITGTAVRHKRNKRPGRTVWSYSNCEAPFHHRKITVALHAATLFISSSLKSRNAAYIVFIPIRSVHYLCCHYGLCFFVHHRNNLGADQFDGAASDFRGRLARVHLKFTYRVSPWLFAVLGYYFVTTSGAAHQRPPWPVRASWTSPGWLVGDPGAHAASHVIPTYLVCHFSTAQGRLWHPLRNKRECRLTAIAQGMPARRLRLPRIAEQGRNQQLTPDDGYHQAAAGSPGQRPGKAADTQPNGQLRLHRSGRWLITAGRNRPTRSQTHYLGCWAAVQVFGNRVLVP
jgi:hypothetical protein